MSLPVARLGAAKRPVVERIRGHQRSCYMALANGLLSGSGVYSIWITSHSGIWNWLMRVINQADPVALVQTLGVRATMALSHNWHHAARTAFQVFDAVLSLTRSFLTLN